MDDRHLILAMDAYLAKRKTRGVLGEGRDDLPSRNHPEEYMRPTNTGKARVYSVGKEARFTPDQHAKALENIKRAHAAMQGSQGIQGQARRNEHADALAHYTAMTKNIQRHGYRS